MLWIFSSQYHFFILIRKRRVGFRLSRKLGHSFITVYGDFSPPSLRYKITNHSFNPIVKRSYFLFDSAFELYDIFSSVVLSPIVCEFVFGNVEPAFILLSFSCLIAVISGFWLQEHHGYPFGSMVDFACDAYGSPIIAVSNLAAHTKVYISYTTISKFSAQLLLLLAFHRKQILLVGGFMSICTLRVC